MPCVHCVPCALSLPGLGCALSSLSQTAPAPSSLKLPFCVLQFVCNVLCCPRLRHYSVCTSLCAKHCVHHAVCTLHYVQYNCVHTTLCALHSVHCTVCTLHCVHTALCAHCTVCTLHCVHSTVCSTMYALHCEQAKQASFKPSHKGLGPCVRSPFCA